MFPRITRGVLTGSHRRSIGHNINNAKRPLGAPSWQQRQARRCCRCRVTGAPGCRTRPGHFLLEAVSVATGVEGDDCLEQLWGDSDTGSEDEVVAERGHFEQRAYQGRRCDAEVLEVDAHTRFPRIYAGVPTMRSSLRMRRNVMTGHSARTDICHIFRGFRSSA